MGVGRLQLERIERTVFNSNKTKEQAIARVTLVSFRLYLCVQARKAAQLINVSDCYQFCRYHEAFRPLFL